MHGVARETKQILGKDEITVLADKGYHNGEQLHPYQENNIITYIAVPEIPRKNEIPTENYYGDKFYYDEEKDQYICPQEKVLTTNGNLYQKKYKRYVTEIKQYKTEACATCPARSQCTSNPRGRILERSQYAKATEETEIELNMI